MGLDQYAYAVAHEGAEPEKIAYWRKHNRLHGWMEQLFINKGNEVTPQGFGNSFNGVPVELTEFDLEQLEACVVNKTMPETGGFFFGDDSFDLEDADGYEFEGTDYWHQCHDIEFIEMARNAIADGKKVYYDSCW